MSHLSMKYRNINSGNTYTSVNTVVTQTMIKSNDALIDLLIYFWHELNVWNGRLPLIAFLL